MYDEWRVVEVVVAIGVIVLVIEVGDWAFGWREEKIENF